MSRPTLTVAILRLRGCHPSRPASQLDRLLSPLGLVRVRSYSPMYSDHKYLSCPTDDRPAPPFSGNGRTTTVKHQVGFPIRRSADQRVLSPPHGLSQSATSFIASYRQGIHQTPFLRLIRPSRRRTAPGNSPKELPGSPHPWILSQPAATLDKRRPVSVSA